MYETLSKYIHEVWQIENAWDGICMKNTCSHVSAKLLDEFARRGEEIPINLHLYRDTWIPCKNVVEFQDDFVDLRVVRQDCTRIFCGHLGLALFLSTGRWYYTRNISVGRIPMDVLGGGSALAITLSTCQNRRQLRVRNLCWT
jgi:hypothetical protein